MNKKYTRENINIYSNNIRCSAWLYIPNHNKKSSIIIMAHGLGGTKEMRLPEYAERFSNEGYACLLFDYRNFGDSDGQKRQLVNVKMQLEDWNNAIDYIKKDKRFNNNEIFLFGSSFSGGHVIYLSSHRNDIKGAISQCPYTNTLATTKQVSLKYIIKKTPYVIADLLSCLIGYHPVMLKLSTYSGENAFMVADKKTTEKFIGNTNFINKVPARTLLEFLKYSPGKYFKKTNNPIYVAVCTKDNLAPAYKTIRLAKKNENVYYKEYNCGHFEIYLDNFFEDAIKDYIIFLKNIKNGE